MPFPLPSPLDVAEGVRARQETALTALKPGVSPVAIARAVRSPRGMINTITGGYAPAAYETHLHLRWWGDQYFPDTAEREKLERHASIWGLTRRAATRAVGTVTFEGVDGTVVPVGLQLLTPLAALIETIATAAIDDGEAIVAVRAIDAGTEGNAEGGAVLSIVTPLAGLDPQAATVDSEGLVGGAGVEDDASLLDRLLETIREPGHGGADFDYRKWVREAFATAKVTAIRNWVGRGSVGVVVAMGDATAPRAPTTGERNAIAAYLETLRPVTAEVIIVPVVLQPVPLWISVTPDTIPVRNAVEAAFRTFLAREATIGGGIPLSRLSEALSSAGGEYSHDILAPTENIAIAPSQLATPGVITWAAP